MSLDVKETGLAGVFKAHIYTFTSAIKIKRVINRKKLFIN